MKKVLIFGATGAIGANASLALKEHGYDVIAVSRRSSDNGFFREYGIPYYSVDITKPDDFAKIEGITDIDTVIHLAGLLPAGMWSVSGGKRWLTWCLCGDWLCRNRLR
jgi:UDP-glucose 4-epimerase